MRRTLDEVRQEGLAALKERFGQTDIIRFLRQFGHGAGDYATGRHEWVDKTSLASIKKAVTARRAKQG